MQMRSKRWSVAILVVIWVATIVFTATASFLVGGVVGQGRLYHSRYLREEEALSASIQNDATFAKIRIEEASNGYACLVGSVPNKAALLQLEAGVRDQIGQMNLRDRMAAVHVEQLKDKGGD